MKSIFKTGTFLTADNLNLAQRASGLTGIIDGCEVSVSDKTLFLAKGLIKFDDGTLVALEGTETIDISNVSPGDYFVVVIQYSSFSTDYSLVKELPDYPYIKLADVTVGTNTIDINNVTKSSFTAEKRVFEYDYLRAYVEEGSILATDAYGVKCFKLNVNESDDSDDSPVVSRTYNIGFIAHSDIASISLKGILTENNQISASVKVNGNILNLKNNPATYLTLNMSTTGDTDYTINIPYGYIKKDDNCCLVLKLFNVIRGNAEATLYNITLN